jgi:hypothetical protein
MTASNWLLLQPHTRKPDSALTFFDLELVQQSRRHQPVVGDLLVDFGTLLAHPLAPQAVGRRLKLQGVHLLLMQQCESHCSERIQTLVTSEGRLWVRSTVWTGGPPLPVYLDKQTCCSWPVQISVLRP